MLSVGEHKPSPYIPNPTNAQRRSMLMESLEEERRPEDFENIVRLLGPPPDVTRFGTPGAFRNIRVGIIGGGLAGMSAAFELRKLGFDITIFEANDKWIGGRIYTYYFDRERCLYGELGAMRIPVSHEATWHYINLFKLNTEPFVESSQNEFIYARNVRVRDDPREEYVERYIYPRYGLTQAERNIPWPRLYSQVSRYYFHSLPPEIRKQLIMILPRYSKRLQELGDISERQAMERFGLSLEAINMIVGIVPTTGALVYNSYQAALNEEYSMDFSNLYRIPGGMVRLPLAFYNSLISQSPREYGNIPQGVLGKVNWRGGHYVTGIFESPGDNRIVLRFRNAEEGVRQEVFDYVISAVPMSLMREMDFDPLMSGPKRQAIMEVRYEDAQKTLFLCRERFWEKQGIFGGISYTDEISETIVYPSDHAYCTPNTEGCSPNDPGVLIASYNLDQDATRLGNTTAGNRFRILKTLTEKVHGLPRGYLDDIVTDFKTMHWNTNIWSKGAFMYSLPGQIRDFLYISVQPEYHNRVFFAGEHASTKNAWMQGALQSGMLAANDLVYYARQQSYKEMKRKQ